MKGILLIVHFLPNVIKESNFNYYTQGTIYDESCLEDLCNLFSRSGWTEEDIAKAVDFGINDYKARTIELIHANDSLQCTLKAIEERDCSPFDHIMRNMRSKIKYN